MSTFDNLKFSDEQKTFFNQRLKEELEKAGARSNIEQSPEEKAILAHELGDLNALKDAKTRAAYLTKYGVNEFGKLHLRHTREQREKKAAEERAAQLAQSKARRTRI